MSSRAGRNPARPAVCPLPPALAGPVLSPAAVEGLPEDCSTDSSAIEAIYFEFSDDSELAESCRRC